MAATFTAPSLRAAPEAGAAGPWRVRRVTQEPVTRQDAQFAYPFVTWHVPRGRFEPVDLFLCDVRTGETKHLAADQHGLARTDGRFVTFITTDAWMLYEIATGERIKVMDKPPRHALTPQVAGNLAVWQLGVVVGADQIFVYDIAARRLVQGPPDGPSRSHLVTDGRTVAWSERPDSMSPGQVWVFDVSTGQSTQLTDDPEWDHVNPLLSGDHVVWQRRTKDQTAIEGVYAHDRTTGRTTRISHEKGLVLLPHHLSGATVVWSETPASGHAGPNNPSHVFRHDLKTGKRTQLTKGNLGGVNAGTDGKLVCWNTFGFTNTPSDVYVADGAKTHVLAQPDDFHVTGTHVDQGVVLLTGAARDPVPGAPLDLQFFLAERKSSGTKKDKPAGAGKPAKPKAAKPKAATRKSGTKKPPAAKAREPKAGGAEP